MESIQDLLRTAREIHAAGDVEGAIGIYQGSSSASPTTPASCMPSAS